MVSMIERLKEKRIIIDTCRKLGIAKSSYYNESIKKLDK